MMPTQLKEDLTMKMFGYVRGLYDLERMAELYGWQINSKDHCNKGSDFVYLFHEERDFLVAVNTINGRFFVTHRLTKNLVATDQSVKLKSEKWYEDLLEILYKEIPCRFLNKKEFSRQLNPLETLKASHAKEDFM